MLLIMLFMIIGVCALQTLRTAHLLSGTLWLAGLSATTATLLYIVGALQLAVLELSIGAGLITVLLVFAISIVGADAPGVAAAPSPPRYRLVFIAAGLLLTALLIWPVTTVPTATNETVFALLWQQRQADVLVQLVLIFAGVLGVLNLLRRAPASTDDTDATEQIAQPEVEQG